MKESSWEIERMFNQENAEKKRTGVGIFSRKSTRRGGAGSIRFAKTKFKKYEKNSKVVTDNLYTTIIPYKEFITFNQEMQQEMLSRWILMYSKEKIKKEMQIGYVALEKLLNKYNIDKESLESSDIVIMNEDDLNDVKKMKKKIDVARFKLLPDHQKYEIVAYWNEELGMLNKEIAVKLGYAENSFNTKKSVWGREYRKIKEEQTRSDNVDGFNDDSLFTIDGAAEKNIESKVIKEKKASEEYNQRNEVVVKEGKEHKVDTGQGNSIGIEIKGMFTGDNLEDKLHGLALLMCKDRNYNVKISIEKIDE